MLPSCKYTDILLHDLMYMLFNSNFLSNRIPVFITQTWTLLIKKYSIQFNSNYSFVIK